MIKTHKKTSLKVVRGIKKKEKLLKDLKINSFWNTCGEIQDEFPCEVCKDEKVWQNWSINRPKHNNCFWEYVRDKSFSDGFMNPLSQAATAKLMGCSPTSIHMIEKSAIEKLKKSPYFYVLRDFLAQEPGDVDQSESSVEIPFSEDSEYSENYEDE